MLRRFDVHKVTSVAEALDLRQRFGADAAIYAGGTELLLAMKMGVARWPNLIDVKPIASLADISTTRDTLRIGATATHWDIERNTEVRRVLPALAQLEANVANVRVRAAGTLAGNLAFGEPHADPPSLLVALGARVLLEGKVGSRSLPVAEFITGMYETALAADEIILAIEIPLFAGADAHDVGTREAIAEAAGAAVEPTADLAGDVEYKRHLVGVFAQRALASLVATAA